MGINQWLKIGTDYNHFLYALVLGVKTKKSNLTVLYRPLSILFS